MAELPDQRIHIRSNSMPSTSHPTMQRAEEELCKLRNDLPSSSRTANGICDGLQSVEQFYELIEELLNLPSCQQSPQCRQKKWVEEQLDCSLRLLDLIDSVRDCFAAMREHVSDLRSTIRRKGNGVSISMKKAHKLIKDSLKALKHIRNKSIPSSIAEKDNYPLAKVLIEGRESTLCILQSVLSFFLKPKQKSSMWSIVSKAVSTRRVACEVEWDNAREESAYMWLQASYHCMASKNVDVEMAQHHLDSFEIRMESLQSGLDCLFKRLIQNRVSLLNFISL